MDPENGAGVGPFTFESGVRILKRNLRFAGRVRGVNDSRQTGGKLTPTPLVPIVLHVDGFATELFANLWKGLVGGQPRGCGDKE